MIGLCMVQLDGDCCRRYNSTLQLLRKFFLDGLIISQIVDLSSLLVTKIRKSG